MIILSHFVAGFNDDAGYVGLNWKSLTQPAILPLTTDYVPPVADLISYGTATYTLILTGTYSGYDCYESLLTEMVCQRLAQEYQLVEGVDLREYRKYLVLGDSAAADEVLLSSSVAPSAAKLRLSDDGAAAAATGTTVIPQTSLKGASPAMSRSTDRSVQRKSAPNICYILTMGNQCISSPSFS